MENNKLVGSFILVLGLIVLLSPVFIKASVYYDEPIIEYTNCYDRYSNEIIDLVCEDEIWFDEKLNLLVTFFPFFMLFGFALMIAGIATFMFENY